MAFKLGREAKLYYKVGGQGGGGSWIELGNVRDVTSSLEMGEADVTTRANIGWEASAATLRKGSIEFEMVWDTADGGFTAIKNAFFGTDHDARMIGLQCLDGESGEGLQADFNVVNFSRSEPLREAITVSVSVKITYSSTPPSWLTG